MQNTVCENCPFVKQGFCNDVKECPNYCESVWVEGSTGEHRILKDCSPKRLLIQNQRLESRLEHLQQAQERSCIEYEKLSSVLLTLVNASKSILELNMEKKNEQNNLIGNDDSIV